VNGKVDGQRYLQFKKRSYDKSQLHFVELLFDKSSILDEAAGECCPFMPPASKRRQKEKQVVMYTDRVTDGETCCLYPMMSLLLNVAEGEAWTDGGWTRVGSFGSRINQARHNVMATME
jgi:hypothetical protein